MTKLIDTIELPAGLRSLSNDELMQLSQELRDELIETMTNSSGHFASSLGACELSVAIHASFNTPEDRIIWDVGHQGYVHKMLTGRRSQMGTIRKRGGISGFLRRDESPYDAFGAGHAGTSISAAVGMSAAFQKTAPERYVVPVIGDGSITAGMAFEALNHAGHLGLKNFIVVINDNEMSISPNVGALSWLFSKAVTSHTSTVARTRFKNLYRKGYVPDLVYKVLDRVEDLTQGFFAGPALLFEAFGLRYIGPVDGHNVADLMQAFKNAKAQDVPVVIHTYTVKGKGYDPAEEDPIKWHAVTPFDRSRGEFLTSKTKQTKTPPSYTQVFSDTLIELAKNDPKIVAITAAMLSGTGLDKFQSALPEQCFDVGICEQHAVTFAAGLACEGFKPVAAIYSTFLQRAYDQVIHDVAIQKLPVVLALDRGGVVGNDGETHQGVFDIAYLRTIPNMTLMSPKDEAELRDMLFTALKHDGPIAVRYPRGTGAGVDLSKDFSLIPIGSSEVVLRGSELLLICFGPMVQYGMSVASAVSAKTGITPTVINARFVKPLDLEMLSREIPQHRIVCTLEDHAIEGGFGSAVLEAIDSMGLMLEVPLQRFGIQDRFVMHASQQEQHQMNGCDPESITSAVIGLIQGKLAANG
jgi:1-deoxy-D-xylulose-5-phosphate synthase